MKHDQLFNIYKEQNFSSKEEILTFLSKESCKYTGISNIEFKNEILKREEQGSIEIAPGVLLPHFESSSFIKSKIFILPIKPEIKEWNEEIQNVHLVIAILLKTDEDSSIKQKITQFTRKLADDEYLDRLMNAETKNNN
ncbi:PTS sugar transporter subunit IIA [Tetragenococcus halophilus]|uniref:PTS sugar transporter subunit IIA n=1 Tax=Tetragenococcus halophilus TaxID=51669 RepID=UPI0030EFDC2F